MKICIRVHVCVWTICTDVKLLFGTWVVLLWFMIFFFSCRGAVHDWQTLPNEDTVSSWWYRAWSALRTCINFHSSEWQPAKPRTGMSNFKHQLWVMTVRFSQSELLLTSSDGTVASSKDLERILFHCLSRLSFIFSCQFFMDCFVHERCIPQQNSQWCFWASVSLIPLSDKVVWALRGRPF